MHVASSLLAEGLAAHVALVRLVPRVRPHVDRQRGPAAHLAAPLTHALLDPPPGHRPARLHARLLHQAPLLGRGVPQLMVVEVCPLAERLAALVAGVGSLASVHALVPVEVAALVERLVAHIARVGPLARMTPHVHQHALLPQELHVADLASEALRGLRVGALVSVEMAALLEPSAAHITSERPL